MLEYVATRTNVELEFVKSNNHDSLLKTLKNGEVDILSSVGKQLIDENSLNHSQSFLTLTEYFFSRPNTPTLYSLLDLKKRKLVLVRNSLFSDWVRSSYPNLTYLEKNTLYDALVAVSNGEADVLVSNYAAVAWLIEKYAFILIVL